MLKTWQLNSRAVSQLLALWEEFPQSYMCLCFTVGTLSLPPTEPTQNIDKTHTPGPAPDLLTLTHWAAPHGFTWHSTNPRPPCTNGYLGNTNTWPTTSTRKRWKNINTATRVKHLAGWCHLVVTLGIICHVTPGGVTTSHVRCGESNSSWKSYIELLKYGSGLASYSKTSN